MAKGLIQFLTFVGLIILNICAFTNDIPFKYGTFWSILGGLLILFEGPLLLILVILVCFTNILDEDLRESVDPKIKKITDWFNRRNN